MCNEIIINFVMQVTPAAMEIATYIGRTLERTNPELYMELKKQVTPILTDHEHIEEIYHMVYNLFSEQPDWMKKLLFVACTYDCYAPGSYIHRSITKLPTGVRDKIALMLGLNNATMANYFRDQTFSYMKFREKEFGSRIEQIKAHFVNGQTKMFA